MNLIAKSLEIAPPAHASKPDKAGGEYVLHLLHAMAKMKPDL